MRIRTLDAATIGRIAAGEVVERPVSVVKELVENSLDAGASAITIEIRDGGASYIRVTDNGTGIAPEDVRMAFENHATSKFSADADLSGIETLGFRGEALPSIASVSKVELETRQADADYGVKITVNAGFVEDVTQCAARKGTSVVVRDLFCNVPVRRAFLKRAGAEATAVTDMVTKMMLAYPNVSFRMISNSRTTNQTFGDGSMRHAALNVLGKEIAQQLIEIDEMEGGFRLHGWVGVEGCSRATRSMQSFFINGRLVHCEMLSDVLGTVTVDRVMSRMFPICALHLALPPQGVDVNVHPNKLAVRFRDEDSVRQTIALLLGRGLKSGSMMSFAEPVSPETKTQPQRPEISFAHNQERIEPTGVSTNQTEVGIKPTEVHDKPTEVSESMPGMAAQQAIAEQKIEQLKYQIPSDSHRMSLREAQLAPFDNWDDDPMAEKPELKLVGEPVREDSAQSEPTEDRPPFTVIGILFQTYLIVEIKDMLMLIDQHAAHERLLYERYMHELDQDCVAQQLLTPILIEVGRPEMEALTDNQTMLQEIGYEIEPFGENAIQLRAIPQLFGKADMQPLIVSMLDHLENLRSATFERRRKDIVRFSCKRAVKAGDRLNNYEIAGLIADMLKSNAPPTCPHGRPVIAKMTRREVERLFKRT